MIQKEKLNSEARRELVRPLLVRGYSSKEIGKRLGVSSVTIRRDFQAIRESTLEQLRENGAEEIKADLELALGEIQKQLWQINEETQETKIKLKALRTLSHICIEKSKLLPTPDKNDNELCETEKKLRAAIDKAREITKERKLAA